jgi:hypothetical protein
MGIREATCKDTAVFHEAPAINAGMNTELANAVRPAGPERAARFVQYLANSPSIQKALHQEIRQKGMALSE